MSDLVWWALFAVLALILTVLTVKLLYRVINDVWCKDDNVLSEDQKDIEDLTRYRTDFRTVFKDAQIRDESDRLMMRKEFINHFTSENEMKVIEEEDEHRSDWGKIHGPEEEETQRNHHVEEEEEKEEEIKKDQPVEVEQKEVEQKEADKKEQKDKHDEEQKKDQVDAGDKTDEEPFTEEEKQILEKILGIEGETDIYAKQIPFCLGGKNHLTYFEFNEKFLRNLIGLSAIDCQKNEKLKKRKELVSLYIQECQNQLKKRAELSI